MKINLFFIIYSPTKFPDKYPMITRQKFKKQSRTDPMKFYNKSSYKTQKFNKMVKKCKKILKI